MLARDRDLVGQPTIGCRRGITVEKVEEANSAALIRYVLVPVYKTLPHCSASPSAPVHPRSRTVVERFVAFSHGRVARRPSPSREPPIRITLIPDGEWVCLASEILRRYTLGSCYEKRGKILRHGSRSYPHRARPTHVAVACVVCMHVHRGSRTGRTHGHLYMGI